MKALLEFNHDIANGTLVVQSKQAFVCGDAGAHEIRFTVLEDGANANLAGYTCEAYCVLSNRSTATESATIAGNVVTVTFPASFYAVTGATGLLLRLLRGGIKYDILCMGYSIRAGITATVYDPSGVLPDLSDFQAAIDAATTAATAANTATSSANTAASAATSVTAAANAAASAANTAAAGAQAEAKKFSAIAVEVKTLPPSAEATGSAAQTASKTTFSFGIPASNLAYATFKIDSRNHLIMTSPEGFSNIGFAINRKTGHLEVQINA